MSSPSSSSTCPPQLQLSIPPNTTSFKRSFEQFGFDLDSPTPGGDSAGSASRSSGINDRRDRNKRARSESSFSDATSSTGSRASMSLSSTSGGSSLSDSAEGDTSSLQIPIPISTAPSSSSSSGISSTFLTAPRIPTPVIQDIDMPDYREQPASIVSETPQDQFRTALARFTEFDRNISALRSRSPSLPRSPTAPPVLPPLSLSDDPSIVPDVEDPASSFDIRTLLGSSTNFQRGSSTQSQASSATDLDYLAPLSVNDPASADQPMSDQPMFTLVDILHDRRAGTAADLSLPLSTNSWSPRLDVLRPSSPLLRDLDDLTPSAPRSSANPPSSAAEPTRRPSSSLPDRDSWPHPRPSRVNTVDRPFLPLPQGIGTASRYFSDTLESLNQSGESSDRDLSDSEWMHQTSRRSANRSYSSTNAMRPRVNDRRSTLAAFGSDGSIDVDRHTDSTELDQQLEAEFAFESDDDDPIPHLPPLPYDRVIRQDPWPESFDRADAYRLRARRSSERTARLRPDLERNGFSRHLPFSRGARNRDSSSSFTTSSSSLHDQANHRASVEPLDWHPRHSVTSSANARNASTSDASRLAQSTPTWPESSRLSPRRTSPTAPVIPPPDLGPGAIFIPHELDNLQASRHAAPSHSHTRSDHHHRNLSDFTWDRQSPMHRPSSPPPSTSNQLPPPSQITPEMYEPGPFRNSLVWLAERRERRLAEESRSRNQRGIAQAAAQDASQAPASAPTLPPLPFEDRTDLAIRTNQLQAAMREHNRISEDLSRFRAYREELQRRRDASRDASLSRAAQPTPAAMDPRPVFSHRFEPEEGSSTSSSRRSAADIHNLLLNRHARSEAANARLQQSHDSLNRTFEALRRANESRPPSSSFEEWGRLEQERERQLDSGDSDRDGERYWAALLDGYAEAHEYSRLLSRYGLPRRRPSPLRAGGNGTRTGTTRHRHGDSSFRPLFVGEYEPFGNPLRARRRYAGFRLGDFMHDEDFDDSYEGLLSLSGMLGDAIPKATPAEVVSKLKTGLFQDWKTAEGDKRCPICLDDYSPTDNVTKLNDCSHWLHKECLEQWLKSASTCPVCRHAVGGPSSTTNLNTPAPALAPAPIARPPRLPRFPPPRPPPHPRDLLGDEDEEDEDELSFYF